MTDQWNEPGYIGDGFTNEYDYDHPVYGNALELGNLPLIQDGTDEPVEFTSKDHYDYKPAVYGFRHPLRLLGIAIESGDLHSWHRAVSLIIQDGFKSQYPNGYKWYGLFGIYVVAYNRIKIAADKLDLTITLHHDMITIAWVLRGKADVFFIRRVTVQQAMDLLEEPSHYEPKPEDFEPTWRAKLALDED